MGARLCEKEVKCCVVLSDAGKQNATFQSIPRNLGTTFKNIGGRPEWRFVSRGGHIPTLGDDVCERIFDFLIQVEKDFQ